MRDHSRGLAFTAFLLCAGSLFLPWWEVEWDDGIGTTEDSAYLFRPEQFLTRDVVPWLTGLLWAMATILIFVRLAAKSRHHEPQSWTRDLFIAAALLGTACASVSLWPDDVHTFWGERTYQMEATGPDVTESASPAMGWWLSAFSGSLLIVAGFQASHTQRTSAAYGG